MDDTTGGPTGRPEHANLPTFLLASKWHLDQTNDNVRPTTPTHSRAFAAACAAACAGSVARSPAGPATSKAPAPN